MSFAAHTLPWLIGIGAALCGVLLVSWPEARTAARVIAQFFLTIALPILVGLARWCCCCQGISTGSIRGSARP